MNTLQTTTPHLTRYWQPIKTSSHTILIKKGELRVTLAHRKLLALFNPNISVNWIDRETAEELNYCIWVAKREDGERIEYCRKQHGSMGRHTGILCKRASRYSSRDKLL